MESERSLQPCTQHGTQKKSSVRINEACKQQRHNCLSGSARAAVASTRSSAYSKSGPAHLRKLDDAHATTRAARQPHAEAVAGVAASAAELSVTAEPAVDADGSSENAAADKAAFSLSASSLIVVASAIGAQSCSQLDAPMIVRGRDAEHVCETVVRAQAQHLRRHTQHAQRQRSDAAPRSTQRSGVHARAGPRSKRAAACPRVCPDVIQHLSMHVWCVHARVAR